jgi:hypothetical protein
MSKFDFFQQELSKLREQVPRLVDLLQIGGDEIGQHWENLDTRLLPLIDRHLPLMVAVCGGANAGKSMFFNSFLGVNLSPVRGDAGSTRRVLVAGHPEIFDRKNLVTSLFEPFGSGPQALTDPTELMHLGPPLYIVHEAVPREQVLMDTPRNCPTGSGSLQRINLHRHQFHLQQSGKYPVHAHDTDRSRYAPVHACLQLFPDF